jgi:hypothetical protein
MTGDALATRNYLRTAPYVIAAAGLSTTRHGDAEEHAHR